MHNHRPRLRASRPLVAVTVAIALLFAACGNSGDDDEGASSETTAAPAGASESPNGDGIGEFEPIEGVPGVTDEEIQFAVTGTGPANPLGYCLLECYRAGVQAHFDYRNSLGGVHGRELTVSQVVDDELGNTQVSMLGLIDAPDVFGIFAAPLLYAGFSDANSARVPVYSTFPASGDADGLDNVYLPGGVQCVLCPSPMTTHQALLAGKSKVASLGTGVSQASKDCVDRAETELNQLGPDVGVEFVYKNNELPFGFPNGLGPEVTAMKELGVDIVTLCIDQTSAIVLEQELRRQGMDDVVVVLPQGYGDDEYFETNADLLEGDIIGVPYRPIEAGGEDTMIPTMVEWLEKTGVQLNDYAIQGWLGADIAVTGLLAAGPQFDRESVIEATNSITDYTAGGILPMVDWTKGHDAPAPDDERRLCMSFLRVVGGELELEGEPEAPFACFDLPMQEWTEAEYGS